MLSISIVAGGRAKSAPEQLLALDYLNKARDQGRSLGFAGFGLTETGGKPLTAWLSPNAFVVLLDEKGRDPGESRMFAQWLAAKRDQGHSNLAFGIGGADGLSEPERARANLTLAFGKQTWPHLLVRTMLAEQIYRAMTILSGHPYHRD